MDVIFEDEFLMAINKPPGLQSQASLDPKRPHVISELNKLFPKTPFFLHHRLDRDTSGVLLLSKSTKANKGLGDIFKEHRIQKTYLALAKPAHQPESLPEFSGEPQPRLSWVVENHLAPVRKSNKQLMRMVVVKKGGWFAKTNFRILRQTPDFDLIEARPVTGRTHQIRVHLASDKRPILGDFLYGGKSSLVPRLMLHAASLELQHPVLETPLVLNAPLPKDFQTLLSKANIDFEISAC